MTNLLSRTCVSLALAFTVGCSTTKPIPAPVACPPVQTPSCPVCPTVDPLTPVCPEPQVIEKIVEVPAPAPVKPATAGKLNLPIVGAVESVTIEPGDLTLPARIDTGAASTSLHAEDIQLVEKDGKNWVHFTLTDPATKEKVAVEQRLRRKISIKKNGDETQRRYVVRLWISLGDTRTLTEVTLSDRDNMEYPLVIGRNLLVDTAIVDVSRKNIATK